MAAIFCQSIISHPQHEMLPQEHVLSQKVFEFLIAQLHWFTVYSTPHPDHDYNIHGVGNRQWKLIIVYGYYQWGFINKIQDIMLVS